MNNNQLSMDDFGSFFSKVELGPTLRCWHWRGKITAYGYGTWREQQAHRVAYEFFVAEIPDDREIHHLCEKRSCVNPSHLSPVTRQEHRGAHRKTHCKRGHPFTLENTYMRPEGRRCRRCRTEAQARHRARLA